MLLLFTYFRIKLDPAYINILKVFKKQGFMRKINSFFKEIKEAKLEREVELVYKKELNYYYPDVVISNPYGCDGLIEKGQLKLILEFKYNENLSDKSTQCKVIIQTLYYIKKFTDDGLKIPDVIMVGDKDEVFVIHNNVILKYLDEDIDWNIQPSRAGMKNPQLIIKMVDDDKIIPFVFYIDDKFLFSQVIERIDSLVKNLSTYVRVTEKNISSIYDYFIINVIRNYKQYSSNELVSIFITLMINSSDTYLHPNKKNVLVLQDGREISIYKDRYLSFFDYFQREYTPKEKEKFTEIADRLIEDTTRRAKGEFYTPTIWVNEAHDIICRTFGTDWREKYTVWDCAWGTGNLTRDFYFNSLFCSTIYDSDLEIGKRYNKNSLKFQYDFLNDDIDILMRRELGISEPKMPVELEDALKSDKPIIFFLNPPYGTAGTMKTDGSHKGGIVNTRVNELMKQHSMGACSQQLYAQFLFRILLFKQYYNLSDVSICIFAAPLYMSGSSFKKFRKMFLSNFKYVNGMLFQANYFDDVSEQWGISFSIWSSGETIDKSNFIHTMKKLENGKGKKLNETVVIGTKNIYNIDDKISFSDWIKEDVKNLKTYEAPLLSSALVVKDKGYGKLAKDALGYYVNSGNSIYDNAGDVFLVSGCSSRGHGISILPCNFNRVMANFAARKIMVGEFAPWFNNKDEYIAPLTQNKKYNEWNTDAIIYSLFNTSSNQSSLRGIKFGEKVWNIENEFFFMSNSEIIELADKHRNDDIYIDAKSFRKDRYVYKYLTQVELSKEAKYVLNKAKILVEKSFAYRRLMHENHPEYHLNTWDAGWYQVKKILKKYFEDDLKDFNNLYKILEQKLRSQLYDLGMLKK